MSASSSPPPVPGTARPAPRGYVVFDLEIHDVEGYAAYRLDGQASIRRFGGRVLSGDPAPEGVVELLEGEWLTKRLVIAEFPTIDIARSWYYSDLYQAAARKRQATSRGRALLVGGWDRPGDWAP
jgi:uncharacterized protein (DUF1330 family)